MREAHITGRRGDLGVGPQPAVRVGCPDRRDEERELWGVLRTERTPRRAQSHIGPRQLGGRSRADGDRGRTRSAHLATLA